MITRERWPRSERSSWMFSIKSLAERTDCLASNICFSKTRLEARLWSTTKSQMWHPRPRDWNSAFTLATARSLFSSLWQLHIGICTKQKSASCVPTPRAKTSAQSEDKIVWVLWCLKRHETWKFHMNRWQITGAEIKSKTTDEVDSIRAINKMVSF